MMSSMVVIKVSGLQAQGTEMHIPTPPTHLPFSVSDNTFKCQTNVPSHTCSEIVL